MLNLRFVKKAKTTEEIKREMLSKVAREQFRKIANFGVAFPIVTYKV